MNLNSQVDKTLPLEFSFYFSRELSELEQVLEESSSLADVILPIEQAILRLFEVEAAVFFQYEPWLDTLTMLYCTSRHVGPITIPCARTSPAGWCAMEQKTLQIDDITDEDHLKIVAPGLFLQSADSMVGDIRLKNCLLTPIRHAGVTLGVIQLMNRDSSRGFTQAHHQALERISQLVGQRFNKELGYAKSPFEALVEKGLISEKLLNDMTTRAERANVPLTLVLRDRLNIPDAEIGQALAEFYQVPWLQYTTEFTRIDEIVEAMGAEFLAKQGWVPLRSRSGENIVLSANPNERESILSLLQIASTDIFDVWVGLPHDVLSYLGMESRLPTELAEAGAALGHLIDIMAEKDGIQSMTEPRSVEDEITEENESIIIPVVNCIIANAVNSKASDVHIQPRPGRRGAKVRQRIDGICVDGIDIPASHYNAVVNRIKIMSGMDIAEHRRPQDGKIIAHVYGETHELRVATLPTVNGESIVLRILHTNTEFPFDNLNFLPHNVPLIKSSIAHPHGMILVAGATGSGKTTTIHGLIHQLNDDSTNIVTVEDPVEITQAGLQQVQVNPRLGLTFAQTARAFMRADPDVIFIGEIRDAETAQVAVEASLTGHLVFTTLHTNSAPETVARLLLMGMDPLNLADALVAVVGQRLIRSICRECRQSYTASEMEVARLAEFLPEEEVAKFRGQELTLYHGLGCSACNGTGLRGRVAIHEVMTCGPELKDLISRRASSKELRDMAIAKGMRPLEHDCAQKVLNGQIRIHELQF